MPHAPSLDAIRSALAPVEVLRGEQTRLEEWVHDSVASLESLHAELAEWQRDLTRQQAEIDERAAATTEAEAAERDATSQLAEAKGQLAEANHQLAEANNELAELKGQIAQSQEDLHQLEDENAEQLRMLGELEKQLAAETIELRLQRKHCQEINTALETERRRAGDEHRQVTTELKDVRRLLERHGEVLEAICEAVDHSGQQSAAPECTDDALQLVGEPDDADRLVARTAELRRRASTRLASRRSPV